MDFEGAVQIVASEKKCCSRNLRIHENNSRSRKQIVPVTFICHFFFTLPPTTTNCLVWRPMEYVLLRRRRDLNLFSLHLVDLDENSSFGKIKELKQVVKEIRYDESLISFSQVQPMGMQ